MQQLKIPRALLLMAFGGLLVLLSLCLKAGLFGAEAWLVVSSLPVFIVGVIATWFGYSKSPSAQLR